MYLFSFRHIGHSKADIVTFTTELPWNLCTIFFYNQTSFMLVWKHVLVLRVFYINDHIYIILPLLPTVTWTGLLLVPSSLQSENGPPPGMQPPSQLHLPPYSTGMFSSGITLKDVTIQIAASLDLMLLSFWCLCLSFFTSSRADW